MRKGGGFEPVAERVEVGFGGRRQHECRRGTQECVRPSPNREGGQRQDSGSEVAIL